MCGISGIYRRTPVASAPDRDELGRIHAALAQIPEGWRRMSRWLNSVMPKGLYARALLIIIAPMVILQSVIAFVFMERHWNVVTQRLSAGVVQDISALIEVYRG